MELKNYQKKASKELLEKSLDLLGKKNGVIVFKSPTGSGKTIVLANFMKRLAEKVEDGNNAETHILSFVWLAPRALHDQSKKKLERYYHNDDSYMLQCKFYKDLNNRQIGENEVLFLNWEGVNREDNVVIRDNEREDYLEKIIERTIDHGRKIVLIIDESHHSANTPKAKNLINTLKPRLIIHVSATPNKNNEDGKIVVHIEDVKAEEMIKKSLVINEGFESNMQGKKIKNDLPTNKSLKEWVLEEGLKKRKEIMKLLHAEGRDTNPLLLVQLPNDTKESRGDSVFDEVTNILKSHGITKESGKLSIHLSGNKENIDNIDWDDGTSEVMLFKQSIALGWDCPRAYILVLFREWSNQIFSIQTLGRIMRIPNPEVGYYETETLNHAYLYTSHEEIEIDKNFSENEISLYKSKRRQDYKKIALPSVYRKQQRDKTRLDPSFVDFFQQESEKYDLKNKINTKKQSVSRMFISDQSYENIDTMDKVKGDIKVTQRFPKDLQNFFDNFVRESIKPLASENRSIARVRDAIYKFFQKEFNLHYVDPSDLTAEMLDDIKFAKNFIEIVDIVLSDHNNSFFSTTIKNAVESYLNAKKEKEEEFVEKNDWQVPEVIDYSSDYTKEEKHKSIMQHFYKRKNPSKEEDAFIDYLEKSSKVAWWFKNGDHGSLYFALPYGNKGNKRLFYVDFIVLLKNGQIGLYDTKKGFTLELAAKEKMKGLTDYINKNNNVVGSIVTNHNGAWRVMPQDTSKVDQPVSEWEALKGL